MEKIRGGGKEEVVKTRGGGKTREGGNTFTSQVV